MGISDYNLKFNQMPDQWDQGLPIGNGKLGCLLYGDNPLCVSVDRIDLWDARPHPATKREDFNYQTLIKLAKSENAADIQKRNELFENIYDELPYPSKITAGRIELNFGGENRPAAGAVDIETGIARCRKGDTFVEAFVHATRPVGILKIRGEFDLKLHIPNYISGKDFENTSDAEGGNITPVKGLQYKAAAVKEKDSFIYYLQKTKTDFAYGLFLYKVVQNGDTYLYFTVKTNKHGNDFENNAKEFLLKTAETGYAVLKRQHISYWKNYWRRSAIFIPDKLLEKTYYRSWYLFASTSRRGGYPMPLQGVWTADSDRLPPWRGDYHHDTNTQMSYQGYLKANRLNEGRCFADYLWRCRPQYKKFAAEFYGVRGLIVPGVSTIDGKPMGGWAQYSLSPTMSIWAAQSFDEYYLYTGSKNFLKTRAYPFFKDIADALLGILEERGGRLYLPLSSSPEIHDAEINAYLTPNTNFDLSLLRYLFATVSGYCKILGKNGSAYADALSKLDDIAIIDGAIALSRDERLCESHRHFSHLMALYPLHLISYDTAAHQALYENSLRQIEALGTQNWVGFSFCMAAQIYAMAKNGDGAYNNLFCFADGFVGENGFHLNGDFKNRGYSHYKYRPFTLEALFGYCDALQEMLLQQHEGYIDVFCAIPKAWAEKPVSFSGLRVYNNRRISAERRNGKTVRIEIQAAKSGKIRIKNSFGKSTITVENRSGSFESSAVNGFFSIALEKGGTKLF